METEEAGTDMAIEETEEIEEEETGMETEEETTGTRETERELGGKTTAIEEGEKRDGRGTVGTKWREGERGDTQTNTNTNPRERQLVWELHVRFDKTAFLEPFLGFMMIKRRR